MKTKSTQISRLTAALLLAGSFWLFCSAFIQAGGKTYLISRPSLKEWSPPASGQKVLPPVEVIARKIVAKKDGSTLRLEECLTPAEEPKKALEKRDSLEQEIPDDYLEPTNLSVSATVYQQQGKHFSRLRLRCGEERLEAWSSMNFLEMTGIVRYVARGVEYHMLVGYGLDLSKSAAEAGCRVSAKRFQQQKARFVVLGEIDKTSQAYEALRGLHAIYNKERAFLSKSYELRLANKQKALKWQAANPPQPQDITIQFWKFDPDTEGKE